MRRKENLPKETSLSESPYNLSKVYQSLLWFANRKDPQSGEALRAL